MKLDGILSKLATIFIFFPKILIELFLLTCRVYINEIFTRKTSQRKNKKKLHKGKIRKNFTKEK